MNEKIIELLRMKGMGDFSSFVLHYNTLFILLGIIFSILFTYFVLMIADDDPEFIIGIGVLVSIIINFIFWCAFMPNSVEAPLANINAVSTEKTLKIKEIDKHHITDSKGDKYNIDLLTNMGTISSEKRDALTKQVNNKPTNFKIYRFKNENIVINYTPQKGTMN